jgi:hypothetical protein
MSLDLQVAAYIRINVSTTTTQNKHNKKSSSTTEAETERSDTSLHSSVTFNIVAWRLGAVV